MFPLPGGRMLGEATRSSILEAAAFYETQSKDMGHKARWLTLVAGNVPENKTVAQVLNEDRLAKLKAEAA